MITKLLLNNCCHFAEANFSKIRVYKPYFKQYFDQDISKARQSFKEVANKYALPQKQVQQLFKNKPQIFVNDSPQRAELEQKIKYLNKLQQTEPIAGVINDVLFDSRHLVVSMTPEDIDNFIAQLKQFGFSKKQAQAIFGSNSNLLHRNFDLIYQERLELFQDYLKMSSQEVLELLASQPFLLTCSAQKLRESVLFFVGQKNDVLTIKKTIKLLKLLGQIFLMGRQQLTMLVKWLKNWGFADNQLWRILLKHPLLFLNHPGEIFHFKAKMLRQFRFTTLMAKQMLRQHPSALICSVRALQSKFLVARDRLKITLDHNNIQFLKYKFGNNIRPRSEMLIKGKVPYTSEDINKYFNCSENEFSRLTGIPIEKLQEEKAKYPITAQLDFPHRKCLQNYPTAEKIIRLSERYYPEVDRIVTK